MACVPAWFGTVSCFLLTPSDDPRPSTASVESCIRHIPVSTWVSMLCVELRSQAQPDLQSDLQADAVPIPI